MNSKQGAWLHNDYDWAEWQRNSLHANIILPPTPNHRARRIKQTIWLWIIVLIFLTGAALSVYGQDLPAAPEPYLHNGINRSLVSADFSIRLMDAVSTRQFMTDQCHCFHETGSMFLGFVSLKPIAASAPAMYAYSLGVATVNTLASSYLWRRGERSKNRHAKSLYRFAARAIPLADGSFDAVVGPVNNWRLMANGPKVTKVTMPIRLPKLY